jgi:histidinol dehydrogenase
MTINMYSSTDFLTAQGGPRRGQRGDIAATIQAKVAEIVASVQQQGDSAVRQFTHEFDGVDLQASPLQVTEAEFDAAEGSIAKPLREAITSAVSNIRAHHRQQVPQPATWLTEISPGVLTGERWTPIPSVGLYVPRGKGSFPSVMAMLCVPARLAGVPYVGVCTPPSVDGSVDAASLFAARLCGVETVYRVGGAQAIAAMAFGTDSIARVDKIIGPGNQYVTAAKRRVYGLVDPGPPAGPSESVILCDEGAAPEVAARELLVEAEHGPDSAALLVTHSAALATAVHEIVPAMMSQLPEGRRAYCETVLSTLGGIVVTRDLSESIDLVNRYAPEHLHLLVAEPLGMLARIKNAGEVLLGEYSSIAFGNYGLGVNAILPTAGMARSFSCVGVTDFMKRSSFAYVTPEGVGPIARTAIELSRYEGFPAHTRAAESARDRAVHDPFT